MSEGKGFLGMDFIHQPLHGEASVHHDETAHFPFARASLDSRMSSAESPASRRPWKTSWWRDDRREMASSPKGSDCTPSAASLATSLSMAARQYCRMEMPLRAAITLRRRCSRGSKSRVKRFLSTSKDLPPSSRPLPQL